MLWFDGWDNAPELHRRCLESWELYNLGWEVRTLSRSDIPGLLGDFMPRYERLRAAMNPLERWGGFWIPPAAESDLLRLLLLVLHGGVWADSTMLCRRPLDSWLPQAASSGFFAFAPESIEQQLPVMSSFLAAEPGHLLVTKWLQRVLEHWSLPSERRKDLGFFWVHHIFGQMVACAAGEAAGEASAERRAWELVPRVTGEYGVRGPHYFVPYTERLRPAPGPELKEVLEDDAETPMWKLTNHEVKLADVGPESCYWMLLEATRRKAREHAMRAAGGAVGPAIAVLSSSARTVVAQRLLAPGHDVGCH